MRKQIGIMLLLLIFVIATVSCNKSIKESDSNSFVLTSSDYNKSNECSNESYGSSDLSNESDDTSYEYNGEIAIYDVYNILPFENRFKSILQNNVIDKKVKDILASAVTTKEMEEAATKSYELWKEEMDYAINLLIIDLSEEQQVVFMENQELWEEYIINNMICDKEILTDGDNYATEFNYLFPLTRTSLYRERTIKIKYLHYIIETNLNKSENEFKSLTFKNS